MSGKVVNLRRVRKIKKREAAKTAADVNAVKFGRTKAEKSIERAKVTKAAHDLDGHKRK